MHEYTPTHPHPHPHPHPLTPTHTAHLLAEGPILHLKFLEVGGEGGLSPTPSRGEEADNNVHHIQRLAKEVWGPELQENIPLYLRGERDLEEEEEVEEGKEGKEEGEVVEEDVVEEVEAEAMEMRGGESK